jgi:hypothetical protein
MEKEKPTIDQFKLKLESFLGEEINKDSSEAAEDFWNNWESFVTLIENRTLSLNISSVRLIKCYPEYGRYNFWKNAGIILILISIGVMWFNLPAGIAFVLLAGASYLWGYCIEKKDFKRFAEEFINEATLNLTDEWLAKLCAHYILGIIQFESPNGKANWPQHPSNVITGKQSFVST